MKDPVFCILDQRTYEREAIEQWLKEHKFAPFNNKELGNKKLEDVLFSNRDIKDEIEEFLEDNPQYKPKNNKFKL